MPVKVKTVKFEVNLVILKVQVNCKVTKKRQKDHAKVKSLS